MIKKTLCTVFWFSIIAFASMSHAMNNTPAEQNKQKVIAFYDAVINQKDFNAAASYLGTRYIQHNPTSADGPEGLEKFITFLRSSYPQAHSEIKHVFAEDNYVILHVHSIREPNTRGRAIIDIFKLEEGKIVEHWDVIQDIPEQAANPNGMF